MQYRVKEWMDHNGILQAGDKVLIACSGGPDSLALLHMFYLNQAAWNIQIAAAHVDHMFRGKESNEDANFVAEFCRERSIPFYFTAIDVPAYIEKTGESPQAAARILRYGFLRQAAEQWGGAKIATGHHQDDQAETVLLHLLRGAGSEGIAAMLPQEGKIIRPFLGVRRGEIEEYCRQWQLRPRQDPSNQTTKYLRNKIRLQLLPELTENYNGRIVEALCRTAEIAAAERDFIRRTAESRLDDTVCFYDEQEEKVASYLGHIANAFVKKDAFNGLHRALQRELVRLVLEKIRGTLNEITLHHIDEVIRMLCCGRTGSMWRVPGGPEIRMDYDGLWVGKSVLCHESVIWDACWVDIPGMVCISELSLWIKTEVIDHVPEKWERTEAYFPLEEMESPLFIRPRQEGDRFFPKGMTGEKKLKEYFIDCKIPRYKRDLVPLVVSSDRIIWVAGHRQASWQKEAGRQYVRISIQSGGSCV